MLEWEHFSEPSVVTVFLALLLMADNGRTDIGLGGLSSVTGLSKNTIRQALARLTDSGEIKRQVCKGQKTITEITNWNEYQVGQKLIHRPKASVSKIDTPVYQKLTQSVSKIDTPHIIDKKNKNNKESVVADTRTRTHEKFIAEALTDMIVERGCMAMRITPDEYRQLVTEVTNDWIFRSIPDNEWTMTHLLAQMRIKHNINNRENGQQTNGGSGRTIDPRTKLDQDAVKAMAALASQIGKPQDVPF